MDGLETSLGCSMQNPSPGLLHNYFISWVDGRLTKIETGQLCFWSIPDVGQVFECCVKLTPTGKAKVIEVLPLA